MKLEFEWNGGKAEANWRDHGVSFELATTAFNDPFAIERLDDRKDHGETRFVLVGRAEGDVLIVRRVHRAGDRIRISARRVTQHEEKDYFEQNS